MIKDGLKRFLYRLLGFAIIVSPHAMLGAAVYLMQFMDEPKRKLYIVLTVIVTMALLFFEYKLMTISNEENVEKERGIN